jgi:hypothetical protein
VAEGQEQQDLKAKSFFDSLAKCDAGTKQVI